jgi:hypothetical protein
VGVIAAIIDTLNESTTVFFFFFFIGIIISRR